MTLSDFTPGKRYLVEESPGTFRDNINEVKCIEISKQAVKLQYQSGSDIWQSESNIKPWKLFEVLEKLKEGEIRIYLNQQT
jgi:hypothetical protein